ncbi:MULTISPECIES: restriction endonuclease subunit S [Microbacterium]|uniref:Restriction endonuclease subunit S n=1 Tax=Microbacterium profundi TaxID=450380 RepID=A0ABV3LHJ8_9MICO|nr:restriction endonuclease subunit S [Microbacterium sp. KRD172]
MKIENLGEIFDGPHATPTRIDQGPYFLNIASLNRGRLSLDLSDHVSEDDFARWTKRVTPQRDDLLFSYETRLGEAALMPDGIRACLGRRMALIRPNREVIDPRFFLYLYLGQAFQETIVLNTIHGATVNRIPLNRMSDWEVQIPPLPEQQAIAEVLGALDDKIAANTRLIDRLLALSNAEFMRRFGDRALEVPLGELGEVVDCLHSKKPERVPTGATLMQLNNIRDDGLVDRTSAYYISTEDYANWSRRFETRAWDFVITNVGRIGAVARIPDGYVAALGRNMTGIRPNDASESGSFIAAAMMSRAVRREIDQRTDAGSVMSALNVKSVPLLRLQESSPSERHDFHVFALPFFKYADTALSENATLAATRDALLPKLMSGLLRVNDAIHHAEEVL